MALAPAVSPSAKMHSNLFGDSNGATTAGDSFHLQMPNLESFFPMNTANQPPLFSVFQSHSNRPGATEKPAQQQTAFLSSQHHNQQHNQQQQQQQNFGENFQQTFASGPNVRGVQQVSKWAETRVTPGAVTSTRSATVSRFVEISSVNGSAQFAQWSTQSKTQTASQGPGQPCSQQVPALYQPHDFELPIVPLDLTAQLGKGNIGRKGSLGGRRPPTSRSRKNSPGPTPVTLESAGFVNATQPVMSTANVVTTPLKATTTSTATTTRAAEAVTVDPNIIPPSSKRGKTPPPRPPPPVFRTPPTIVARGGQRGQGQGKTKAQDKEISSVLHSIEQQEFPDTLKLFFVADSKSPTMRCDDARSTSSTCSVPPPLPTSTPPALSSLTDTLDMVFVERASPVIEQLVTEVVDIRDKESVENGEIVRRRTVVTLGPKNAGIDDPEDSEPAWKRELRTRRSLRSSRENKGSGVEETTDIPVVSGTINVTLKSANNSSGGYQAVKREGVSTMFVRAADQEQRPARASAFNVRRTIEQRRNNANQQRANSPSASANQDNQLGAPSQSGSGRSTYLFGENPSLAGSSDLSIARTLSISMSLEDLDSSTESSSTNRRGPKKNEAWYERRQSYGFEAAEKFQSSKNKHDGNSDAFDSGSGRSTRLSRSWDSIDSHNKNGVTNFSELIPPWIRENRQLDENPPSVEVVPDLPDLPEPVVQSAFPTYVFGGQDPEPAVHPAAEPPQQNSVPLRRSESSSAKERPRSTANILDDDYEAKEPIWLRDLKMRRSLRESRHAGTESKNGSPVAEPPWRNVKLRPTGLRLVSGELSPARPMSEPLPETKTSIFSRPSTPGSTTSTDSRVLKLIERSRRNSRELLSVVTGHPEAEVASPATAGTVKTEDSDILTDRKLLHRKSIELMKLLDETPYVSPKPDEKPDDRLPDKMSEFDRESVFTRNSEATDLPEESSAGTSLQASAEDLMHPTQRKTKKVGFANGVKEESDQMIRPRRLRSKSPETRLKEWQAQREARNAAAHSEEAFTAYAKEANLPLMLFGDVNTDGVPGHSSTPAGTTTSTQPGKPAPEVSEVFRSLLQPRRPYSYPNSVPSFPSKETVTLPPPPPPPPAPAPEVKPLDDSFTSELAPPSPERKIVVVFEENGPPPKSILKKRSLENLLDDRSSAALETWSQRSVSSVTSSNINHRPSYLFSTPNITSTQDRTLDEPGSTPNSRAPWRVNLKHVDPSQRVKSPDEGENLVTWKAELLRKKATSPQRLNCSSPAERVVSEPSRIAPAVFVAHCEVATDANPFKGTSLDTPKSLTVIEDLVKHDLGYHSLEVETGEMKTMESASVRLNRPSPLVNQPVVEPQITKIRLRPVGRPKTPEYQEPVHVSPQKSLRKPLSPKVQHKNVAHISCTISSGTSPGKELIKTPVPGRKDDGVSRTNIMMTSSAAEKDLHEQIERLSATFQEAQNETSRTTQPEEDAASRHSTSSSNWRLSSRPTQANSRPTIEEEVKKPLVELNPRVPSLGHPSASWRMTSSTENRVQVFEDEFLKTANQLANRTVFASSSIIEGLRTSPERNATPEPDFAEFKRSLEKLLSKTDSISEISAAESSDSIVIIESKRETRTSTSLDNSSSSTVEEKTIRRPGSQVPKPPERRKSHPLTKFESSPATLEHAPKQLTLGMPQDKATLLVRSFFSSSVIDSKRNRFSKTETILEESSPATTPSLTPVASRSDITLANELTVTDLSYDSDDQFQLSGTDLNSDFGSALDILNESVDAQDEFTMLKPCEYSSSSARSEASTIRAYSGSERSVRLSDILSQPSTTSSRRSTSVTSPVSSRGTPDRLSSSRIPLRVDSPSSTSVTTPSSVPKRSSIFSLSKSQRPNSMTSSTDDVKTTSTKVIRRRNSKKSKTSEKPAVSKQSTRKHSTDSSEPEDGRTVRTRNPTSVQVKKREPSKPIPVRSAQQVPERPARKAPAVADKTAGPAVGIKRTTTATSTTSVRNPIMTTSAVRNSVASGATKRQSVVTASRSSRGSPAAYAAVTNASQEGHKTARTSLLVAGASSSSSTRTSVSSAKVTPAVRSSTAKPRSTIQTQTKVSTQRVGIWV